MRLDLAPYGKPKVTIKRISDFYNVVCSEHGEVGAYVLEDNAKIVQARHQLKH